MIFELNKLALALTLTLAGLVSCAGRWLDPREGICVQAVLGVPRVLLLLPHTAQLLLTVFV